MPDLAPFDPTFSFVFPSTLADPSAELPSVCSDPDLSMSGIEHPDTGTLSNFDSILLSGFEDQSQDLQPQPNDVLATSSLSSAMQPTGPPGIQSVNPRPLQSPDPNFTYDFGLLDPTMLDLSCMFDMSIFGQEVSSSSPARLNTIPSTSAVSERPKVWDQYTLRPDLELYDAGHSEEPESSPPEAGSSVFSSLVELSTSNFATTITGGWPDADDFSSTFRDHLYVEGLVYLVQEADETGWTCTLLERAFSIRP